MILNTPLSPGYRSRFNPILSEPVPWSPLEWVYGAIRHRYRLFSGLDRVGGKAVIKSPAKALRRPGQGENIAAGSWLRRTGGHGRP